jgi:S-adenosylmethionine synthetase
VACETLVTTGQVVLAGEVTSNCYIDVNQIVRKVIADIGYTKSEYKFEAESCGIFTALHEQSSDINMGVSRAVAENQGAGDQGMMFGYATDETDNFMPLTLDIAHTLVYTLARIRKEGKQMHYLRPDSKSQVTIEYDDEGRALRIDTIVLSTQHDPDVSQEQIRKDVQEILIPRVLSRDSRYAELFGKSDYKLLVNPTGQFVIGGPHGDTGLTGRKIIVDTYGGRGAHGGGAFSGKDPSKVDRSAAYMARYMAKNLVAAGVAHEALVQISYAIGVAEPVSLNVNTNGTAMVKMSDGEIAKKLGELFDLRPYAIEQTLHLREPIYTESASYGHVGRTPQVVEKTFVDGNGKPFTKKVKLFSWEELDRVNDIKKSFGIL